MTALRLLLIVILTAAVNLALPQHDEDFTFEDKAAPLQESALPSVLWPLSTDDEDYEGSAMGVEEWFHLHPVVPSVRASRPLSGRLLQGALANCPGDDVFTCRSGDVICGVQRCDGVADCPDWDDEAGCECHGDKFHCDGVLCIDNSSVCDGIHDCLDGTDEENCGFTTVASSTTTTPNATFPNVTVTATPPRTTTSISTSTTTATVPSCRNNTTPRLCKDGKTFACFCDGVVECPHGEDEYRCQSAGCRPREWRCRCDGSCIPEHAVCNRRKDCPDGSDERGCVPGTRWWKCRCGGWIRMRKRCDGRRDCYDGSDERFCPQRHYCHGSLHWLFSLSAHHRLENLLNYVYDGNDDSDEDD